ncbi:MAG: AAA family ATPase [Candidatus Micrarchaeia archaeon]
MDFRSILAEKSVFFNRDALSHHFLPDKIMYRDREIEKIMRTLTPLFHNKRPRNMFLYGKPGTGKTASIKYVMKQFIQVPSNGKMLYINCRMYSSRYKILQKITSDLISFAKNGFAPSVFYEKITKWVEEGQRYLIVVLDEIDMVKDLDELIYTITRSNDELKAGGISLIGISNSVVFKKKLDIRSRSSLLETEVVFPPYDAEQLKGILKQRAEIGFYEGVCDDSAISNAAAIAAKETGDARYALKLLLYAGEIADERRDKKITYTHVDIARKAVEEDIVVETISTLPEQQQLILYSLSLLTLKGSKYSKLTDEPESMFLSGELYEMYSDVCKQMKRERRSARWCKEYLRELESLGLVQTVESGKGIRGHSTLIRLNYAPSRIKKAIEELLV